MGTKAFCGVLALVSAMSLSQANADSKWHWINGVPDGLELSGTTFRIEAVEAFGHPAFQVYDGNKKIALMSTLVGAKEIAEQQAQTKIDIDSLKHK